MSFTTAITRCLNHYAVFAGRARRSEFWWFFLFMIVVSIPFTAVPGTAATVISTLLSLAVLVPALAVGARRLHDTGRSGWWQALWLVPFGFIVVMVWWASSGEPHANQHGEIPAAA